MNVRMMLIGSDTVYVCVDGDCWNKIGHFGGYVKEGIKLGLSQVYLE